MLLACLDPAIPVAESDESHADDSPGGMVYPGMKTCSLPAALAVAGSALWIAPARAVAQDAPPEVARAVASTIAAPRIDGTLDEAAWAQAPVISDFVQKIPAEGAMPSVRNEVRPLYDEAALHDPLRLGGRRRAVRPVDLWMRPDRMGENIFVVKLSDWLGLK